MLKVPKIYFPREYHKFCLGPVKSPRIKWTAGTQSGNLGKGFRIETFISGDYCVDQDGAADDILEVEYKLYCH